MTTLDNAFADRDSEILARPAAKNPATLGEIWRSEWQASGLDTMTGVGKPWADAADELETTYRNVTGETVFEAASRRGVKLPGSSYEGRAEAVRQLSGDLDLSQRRAIEPLLDLRSRARAKASEIEKQSRDIEDRTYGISGAAVGFLAGVARQAVDPVNLATLPLGAARGVGVLRMLATEGGIGMATQAAQEPFIQSGRADLGLEAGFGQAVGNTLEAGLGAAGFAGLLRGAGFVARRAFGAPAGAIEAPIAPVRSEGADLAAAAGRAADPAMPEVPAPHPLEARTDAFDPDLHRAMADLHPDDFDAVAHVVERDALVERMAVLPTGEAIQAHVARVDAAAGALETGRVDFLPAAVGRGLPDDMTAPLAPAPDAASGPRIGVDDIRSAFADLAAIQQRDMFNALPDERRAWAAQKSDLIEALAARLGIPDHDGIGRLIDADPQAGLLASDKRGLLGEAANLIERDIPQARDDRGVEALMPGARAERVAAHEARLAQIATDLLSPEITRPALRAYAADLAAGTAQPPRRFSETAPAAPAPSLAVSVKAEATRPVLPKAADPAEAARFADVERAMAANGGDLDLFLPGPDGQVVKTSARAEFARIETEANAARELKACLGLGGGS